MKAEELRIGNWFNESGLPTQADGRFIGRLQNIQSFNRTMKELKSLQRFGVLQTAFRHLQRLLFY